MFLSDHVSPRVKTKYKQNEALFAYQIDESIIP